MEEEGTGDSVLSIEGEAREPVIPRAPDPDFARTVLEDLYTYRRKRPWVAWVLWGTLGLAGAHRFYLERVWSGLAMMFTGGGGLFWWAADAAFVNRLVREHNDEQARRAREGLPPVELEFMPPLSPELLAEPPAWTVRWASRSRGWRLLRLVGDMLVLLTAATLLGALAGENGALEAVVAVSAVILATLLGGHVGALGRVPGARALVRWTHRLRLFYYYNSPGTPPGLLLRTLLGAVYAPFRRRDRTEVRLYLELGAVFTIGFLFLNILEYVIAPVREGGMAALSLGAAVEGWLAEAVVTFVLTSAFVAPIGAVLTLYLLTRRSHTVARVLGLGTLGWLLLVAG